MRLAVIGGGVHAAQLCEVLARDPALPALDVALFARRSEPLGAIAAHAARRVARARPDWRVRAHATLAEAVADAAIAILLVRVGGLAARARDESFPTRFGLVGDEGLGPGGFANAWRTLPVLAEMAAVLGRAAPKCRVLNLMAPLGITTRLLLDAGLDAIGLCELPLITRAKLLAAADRSVALRYAGFNHLGWFFADDETGRAALRAAAEAKVVDAAVLAEFGAAPLHYYEDVFDPAAARRLGRVRAPGRAEFLEALAERVLARMRAAPGEPIAELAERPTVWFDLAVAPAVAALLAGTPHAAFANVRNGQRIPELPADAVVEMEAPFADRTLHPIAPGPLPPRVADFLRATARAEDLAYRAARSGDPDGIGDALRALPLAIDESAIPGLVRAVCDGPSEDAARSASGGSAA